jgi:hypothetical protein
VDENLTLVDVPQIGSNGKRRQCGLSTTNVTRLGSQHALASIFRLKNHDPQQLARGRRRICAPFVYGFSAAVMTRLTGTFTPLCGRWCAHTPCGPHSPSPRAVRVSTAMKGIPSGGHWRGTTSLSQGNGNLISPQTRLIEGNHGAPSRTFECRLWHSERRSPRHLCRRTQMRPLRRPHCFGLTVP